MFYDMLATKRRPKPTHEKKTTQTNETDSVPLGVIFFRLPTDRNEFVRKSL